MLGTGKSTFMKAKSGVGFGHPYDGVIRSGNLCPEKSEGLVMFTTLSKT
jgi:hypothetical protein